MMDDLSPVQPPLFPGERVLWSGRPGKRLILRKIDIFLIPFSLFWTGFVVFWNVSVWSSGAPLDFSLFGIPFLLAGIYVTVGRFAIDAFRVVRLRYFVTTARVIIMRAGSSSIQSLDIRRLPALSMEERRDGSGSLVFGDQSLFGGVNGLGLWQATAATPPRFLAIPKVSQVFQLIGGEAARH